MTNIKQQNMADEAYWDDFADDYVTIQRASEIPLPQTIAAFLKKQRILPTDSLLDLGAGSGRFFGVFSPLVARLIALDISTQMLRYGRQLAEKQQLNNITFIHAPWSSLTKQQQMADVVFANMFGVLRDAQAMGQLSQLAKKNVVLGQFTARQSVLDRQVSQAVTLRPESNSYTDDINWQRKVSLQALGQQFATKTFHFQTTESVAKSLLLADLADRIDPGQTATLQAKLNAMYQKKPTLLDRIDYTYELIFWQVN
ncbi:MAG: methyltransferase domain-containing protein [Lactobacillus sp.]|jgi:SAM-dependent methyltransferase|nr:methyltransferase domain-containing protein [Lactobacillus sp.]